MNEVTMIGIISSVPKKSEKSGLFNFGLTSVSPYNTDISVKARCLLNEKVSATFNSQAFRVGSLVVIHGELRSYTKPNENFRNFYNYVLINKIEFLRKREIKINFDFNKFMQQFDITKVDQMRKNLAKQYEEKMNEEKEGKN